MTTVTCKNLSILDSFIYSFLFNVLEYLVLYHDIMYFIKFCNIFAWKYWINNHFGSRMCKLVTITTTEDAFYIGYLIYTTSVFNHRGLRHPQKSFRYQRRLPRTVLECALILRRSRGRARLRMQWILRRSWRKSS